MTSVALHSTSKYYGSVPVVSDVDLTVEDGEFMVLLGPSGCGKTTTLRMVAGFVKPTTGRILLGGKDVTAVPTRLRDIGMVFQNYALFPNMTVRENIAFGLKQRSTDRKVAERRVDDMLDLVQLRNRGSHYPSQLSGGQQQRVALARALSFSPRILLMDEPLSALDTKLRESMQIELRRIQRELGITTILVTHDQQEAMTLADRIVVMAQGKIQQIGTPADLYRHPTNKFVAQFLGKNNIFTGELGKSNGGSPEIRLPDGTALEVDSECAGVGNIELSVRPEHLDILAESPACKSGVPGIVEHRQFLGNVIYYFVKLPWGETATVEKTERSAAFELGDRVRLSWTPGAENVLRQEGQ